MKRHGIDDGTAIGCLILVFGGCSFIGGFSFFVKMLIALFAGA